MTIQKLIFAGTVVWTCIAGPLLLLAVVNYYFNQPAVPPPPGDPNIGLGILYLTMMLNIPTVILWPITGFVYLWDTI